MRWGLQNRDRVLRGILPLLTLVWATVTWHDCYLDGMHAEGAATSAAGHCGHHQVIDVAIEFAFDLPVDDRAPSCDEVADVGPDLRPAPPEMLAARSFGFLPVPIAETDRSDRARAWRTTSPAPEMPLHQRPARLLI